MAKNILIIEDETTLRELMRSQLERAGYEVTVASDGRRGLELARTGHPDLVLLDFLLPAKNGIEVLKALREDGNHTQVLVVSNSGNQDEVQELLRLGAHDYLVKANFTPDEVLAKVQEVLGDTPTAVPAAPPPSPEIPAEAAAEEDGTPIDILLIEDDRFLQELLKKKLVNEGYAVRTADEGEVGLRLAGELRPRLILLDLLLPGMDGFEFLSAAGRDEALTRIPIVVLSNLGQREEIDRALSLGARDYLIKADFAPDEILKKLKPMLAAHS